MFLLVVVTSTACTDKDKKPSHPVVTNDAVNIVYTDTGTGDTTLLFVHGWAINKEYWNDQVSFFSDRYRVVTVDLPGFGRSGTNRKDWSVINYGKDLTAVIDSLGLRNVVLVGHSMSGAIVLEAALQNRDKVIRVIGIDNFKSYGQHMDSASRVELAGIYREMRSNYRNTITQYANQALFSDSTSAADRKRILGDFSKTDSVIAVNVMETGDGYAMDSSIRLYNEPVYLVNSDSSPNDTASFISHHIPYRLFTIHATGHYPMIEKPAAFNQLLQDAILAK